MMKWIVCCLLTGIVAGTSLIADQPAATASASQRDVLIVVDMQNFYFPGGMMPLENSQAAAAQAARLQQEFRAKKWPVIHVRHVPPQVTNADKDPQYDIHSVVKPLIGEKVIIKHFANSFRETDLLAHLKTLQVRRVVICGMQTQMCVEAATRAAADYGFDVVLAGDACATRKLDYGGSEVAAAQVQTAVLAAMDGNYARVVTVNKLLAEMSTAK